MSKDFFISYNSTDHAWAEWIAWVLEEHGYSLIIQAWDFRPGGNFILDMQRATTEAQRTVVVLSEAYLKALYTQSEWAAALTQDPTAIARKLLPIRVAPCKPTGVLAPLVYVDLVGKTESASEELLLEALRERGKPETRPSFPQPFSVLDQAKSTAAVFPGVPSRSTGADNSVHTNVPTTLPSLEQRGEGMVVFNANQGTNFPQRLLHVEREVPSLLPYLPNRTNQEFELGRAVKKLLHQVPRRPLVCIIHGDEHQSHDKFLERLRKITLPRLLRLDVRQTAIQEYHLRWPSRLNSLMSLSDRLRQNLADTVENYSLAPTEKINETFSRCPAPVLVHMHLLTEDWQRLGTALLPKVLEFWQSWPELAPDQVLIVSLFIHYQKKRPTKAYKWWWWLRPITLLRRHLRARRSQRLNQEVYQQIESIAKLEFEQFDRLIGVALPKLENITQGQIEDWVRCEATKLVIGDEMPGTLVDSVRELFDRWEIQTASRTMSMDDAAAHLKKLLESVLTARRNRS